MHRALIALGSLAAAFAVAAPLRGQDAPLGVAGALDDPGGRVGAALRSALDAASPDGRTVRLTFWGASHTASDQYTAPIRARLRRRYGDAGSGLVMPAQPLWLYEMRDFDVPEVPAFAGRFVRGATRVPGNYGRAGMALDVEVASRAELVPRRGVRFAAVALWAEARAGGGTVTLSVDGHEATLHTGVDGAGFGEVRVVVPLGSHCIEVRAHGDGPVRIFGVVPETGTGGVTVEAFGVPGARARDWAPWDEAAMRAQLAARPSDLVAIAYGTNESGDGTALATVEAQLDATLDRLAAVAPTVPCLVIGPSDRPRLRDAHHEPRPRSTAMAELFHRRALAHGCAFFDTLAWQGGAGSMMAWVARGLALDDHVHLTDEGYEQMADALLEGLGL
jgi:lysophospholipase L1-like esterase